MGFFLFFPPWLNFTIPDYYSLRLIVFIVTVIVLAIDSQVSKQAISNIIVCRDNNFISFYMQAGFSFSVYMKKQCTKKFKC